ncbi:Hypp8546 [Branchiostoma lanceolatum]|uniref:Hypp8546 protein n=1 Tax=Branchiostoma lanceolatum TaxID=7740 RepID=A0A8J9Z8P2_BRALA|nr:Hypp8546 [Branchiostoma lanceolatum]
MMSTSPRNARHGAGKAVCHTISDFLVIVLIITPAVNLFWRGTWNIMYEYLVPEDIIISSWLSLAIGSPVLLLAGLLQHPIRRLGSWIHGKSKSWHHLYLAVYVYVVASASVAQWRGFWNLPTYYFPEWVSVPGFGVTAVIGTGLMVGLRIFANGGGCPAGITVDFEPDPFRVPLRFHTDRAERFSWRFALDVFFSVFVLDLISLAYWAGYWGLLDVLMFPEDPCFSYWVSLGIGYAIHLVTIFLQFPVHKASRNLRGAKREFWKRLALEDAFLFVVNFGVVNSWRGLWDLYDCYFLPDQPKLSAWLSVGIGALLCYLLRAGRTLGGIGITVDGEEEDGTGVLLSTYAETHEMLPWLKHLRKREGDDSGNFVALRTFDTEGSRKATDHTSASDLAGNQGTAADLIKSSANTEYFRLYQPLRVAGKIVEIVQIESTV